MTQSLETPIAEVADRRWHVLALAMFLWALKSATSAAMEVASDPYLRFLDWAEAGFALATLFVALRFASFKFKKVPKEQRRRLFEMEGYVKTVVLNAFRTSWSATFLCLVVLLVLGPFASTISTDFFLHLVMAVMLGVFSVVFFAMNASSDEPEGVIDA